MESPSFSLKSLMEKTPGLSLSLDVAVVVLWTLFVMLLTRITMKRQYLKTNLSKPAPPSVTVPVNSTPVKIEREPSSPGKPDEFRASTPPKLPNIPENKALTMSAPAKLGEGTLLSPRMRGGQKHARTMSVGQTRIRKLSMLLKIANRKQFSESLNVPALIAEECSPEEFKAKLLSFQLQTSDNNQQGSTIDTMVEMYRSLKSFNDLLSMTAVLNADMHKSAVLPNIIRAVHASVSCEAVALFEVEEEPTGLLRLMLCAESEPDEQQQQQQQQQQQSTTPKESKQATPHQKPPLLMSPSSDGMRTAGNFSATPLESPSTQQRMAFRKRLAQHSQRFRRDSLQIPVSSLPAALNKTLPLQNGLIGYVARTGELINLNLNSSPPQATATPPSPNPASLSSGANNNNGNGYGFAAMSPDSAPSPRTSSNSPRTTFAARDDSKLGTAELDKAIGFVTRTSLTVPIMSISTNQSPSRCIAVIHACNKRVGEAKGMAFSSDDELMLTFVAQIASQVLANSQLYERVLMRQRQQDALVRVIDLVSAESSAEQVIARMIEAAFALLDADRVSLFVIDPITHDLVLRMSNDLERELRVPLDRKSIVGTVATSGQLLNVRDAQSDSRFDATSDKQTGYVTKTLLTVPVQDRTGQTCAVLQAINKKHGHFTEEDEILIHSLAQSTGEILRKAQTYDALLQEQKRAKALMTVMQAQDELSRDENVERLIEKIIKVAKEVMDSEKVGLFFVDAVREQLFCVVSSDSKAFSMPMSEGIVGRVARTGQLLNIADASKSQWFYGEQDKLSGFRTKSVLSVPIINSGRTIAVLQAVNKTRKPHFSRQQSKQTSAPSSVTSSPESKRSTIRMNLAAALGSGNTNAISSNDGQNNRSPNGTLIHGSEGLMSHLTAAFDPSMTYNPAAALQNGIGVSSGSTSTSLLSAPSTPSRRTEFSPRKRLPTVDYTATGEEKLEKEVCSFTIEDEQLLQALCAQIGVTLKRNLTAVMLERFYGQQTMEPGSETVSQVDSLLETYGTAPRPRGLDRLRSSNPHSNNKLTGSGNKVGGYKELPRGVPTLSRIIGQSRAKLLAEMRTPQFDVLEYTAEELVDLSLLIFRDALQLDISTHGITLANLTPFIAAVQSKYRPGNSYHNWHHAVFVLWFSYTILRCTPVLEHVTQLDVLGLLISALCHDLDHPGNTNQFEVNSGSRLALIYNDNAVLENHHASMTFNLMQDPNLNFISRSKLDATEQKQLRKVIIGAILATDMSTHFDTCKRLDNMQPLKTQDAATRSDADRQFLVDVITHAADLGNATMPFKVAKQWEGRVVAEFKSQAEREQKLGLPVAPYMLNLNDDKARARNQVAFIDFIVSPLWTRLPDLLPGLEPWVKQLIENRRIYNEQTAAATDLTNSRESPSKPPEMPATPESKADVKESRATPS